MVGIGPVISFTRAAPMADEVAGFVELENRWSGQAAIGSGRIGGGVEFHAFESGSAVDNPDVILGVDGDADDVADDPMVGKRLGPEWLYFEARGLHSGSLNDGSSLKD